MSDTVFKTSLSGHHREESLPSMEERRPHQLEGCIFVKTASDRIIAALAQELKPLVCGWSRQPDGAYLSQRGEVALIAVAQGMGAVRAERAVAIAETYGSLDAMVSIGWAGGASCGVQPGTAYEVGEVIDPKSGERYVTAAVTSPLKLATLDFVAGRDEKRRIAETYGASWWIWKRLRLPGWPAAKAQRSSAGRR